MASDWNRMTPKGIIFAVLGASLLTVIVIVLKDQQQHSYPTPSSVNSNLSSSQNDDGWRCLIGNINPPQSLYYRSDKVYFGKLIGIRDDHTFQDGTQGKAVKILFDDGRSVWMSREVVTKMYVTKITKQ